MTDRLGSDWLHALTAGLSVFCNASEGRSRENDVRLGRNSLARAHAEHARIDSEFG
jgi:hypothetical protein